MSNEAGRCEVRGLYVPRRRRLRLRIATADNNQILVDHPRSGQGNRQCTEVALHPRNTEPLAKINVPAFAKAVDQVPSFCVKAEQEIHHPGIDATALSVTPVRNSRAG